MRCQSCSYENEAESKVCDNCGKALIGGPSAGGSPRRPVTRGEKVLGFIAGYIVLIAGGFLLWKLTGATWVAVITTLLLFGSGPAVLRLLSPKTREELSGELAKGEIREAKDLRSIVSIRDKIARLESQAGNEKEIWKLHRQAAGMYEWAFTQGFVMFDRITDGNLVLLAKSQEELIWARDHAGNDKDRHWAEKNLERQRKKIDKWRSRAAEIIANPALLRKINRNYAVIIRKHYLTSGFSPEDYLRRLNEAFPG